MVANVDPGLRRVEVHCRICGSKHILTMNEFQWDEYLSGVGYAQDIFPNWTHEERELLITQICGPCFDKMFPEEDEDEQGD